MSHVFLAPSSAPVAPDALNVIRRGVLIGRNLSPADAAGLVESFREARSTGKRKSKIDEIDGVNASDYRFERTTQAEVDGIAASFRRDCAAAAKLTSDVYGPIR